MKIVVKIGGAALDQQELVQRCARAVIELATEGHQVAVVHGGGAALTRTLSQLGKQSTFVNGLRVTDAETRDVALMVLAGRMNKELVAALGTAGRAAVGMCGGDGLSFRARKKVSKGGDLGFVGEICALVFLTDVAGVKGADGKVMRWLSLAAVPAMSEAGVISGGMLPKLQACQEALTKGVAKVRILPATAADLLPQLYFAKIESGTEVTLQ